MQRKVGLDYLRAAAILCVLTAHTAGENPLGALGFIGVEIFFVLSGYLIGGILLAAYADRGDAGSWPMLRDFWIRRWLRTIPNYFLFLPIYIAAERYGLPKQLLLYLTFTQNFAWPMGRFFSVSWSLAIEEWFYILLPLLLILLLRLFGRVKPALIVAVLLMFFIPFFLRLTLAQGHPFDSGMRKIVVFRLDALMWGVALAGAERFRSGIFNSLCNLFCVFGGIAGILLAAWWVWIRYQHDHGFSATVGGALVITAVSICAALVLPYASAIPWKKSFANRCAYLVSNWSYSIYLSHGLVIWVTGIYFNDPQLHHVAAVATAWVLTFAFSAGIHYSFEKPILKWRDRMTSKRLP